MLTLVPLLSQRSLRAQPRSLETPRMATRDSVFSLPSATCVLKQTLARLRDKQPDFSVHHRRDLVSQNLLEDLPGSWRTSPDDRHSSTPISERETPPLKAAIRGPAVWL